MNDRMKWGAVFVLLLAWAVLLVVRWLDRPTPERVPLTYRSGRVVARDSVPSLLQEPAGRRLAQARGTPPPFKTPKNIFAPLGSDDDRADGTQRKRELRAKRAPSSVVTAPVPIPPVAPPPSAEEVARREAQQAIAQYRFLGYLTQAGRARAFLGRGQQIYIVAAGDLLDERLRVQAITASSVLVKDAGTSIEGAIPLSPGDGRGF